MPLIAAVIVTYHPDRSLLCRVVGETAAQVDYVVVVDNGSSVGLQALVSALPEAAKVKFVSLNDNYGIAYAHNQGIESARALGCRYVLLLDQDSTPSPGMTQTLLNAIDDAEATGLSVSAAGPRWIDPDTGAQGHFMALGGFGMRGTVCDSLSGADRVVFADFLISSGSLIPLRVVDAVGAMSEELFIDHVDTEWYLRAKSLGYRALGVCDATLEHHLGNDVVRVNLLRQRFVPVHSPLRLYYMIRNSLVLYRKHYAPWRWIAFDLKRLVFIVVFFSLFIRPRAKNVAMIMRGLRDGLQGRTGKFHDRILVKPRLPDGR